MGTVIDGVALLCLLRWCIAAAIVVVAPLVLTATAEGLEDPGKSPNHGTDFPVATDIDKNYRR